MEQKAEPPLAFLSRPPSCLELLGAEKVDLDSVQQVFNDEARNLQNRLREQLSQLRIESGLFLRLMYKNKNQHRRTLYYQRLSEVRRDLQMLSKSGLDETVEGFVKFFTAKRPDDVPSKAITQTKFKDAIDESKALRTLLSVARLLNQSDGPIMTGSAQLVGLLGLSFFMPFALTMFSCLARFRMLLLQILYEVVTAFNLLFTVWQKKQKSLIYSVHGKSVSASSLVQSLPAELECQWDGVKLSMTERRTARFPDRRETVSGVTAEPTQLWFVDDRTGVKCDLPAPTAIAGPSGEQLGVKLQVPANVSKDTSIAPDLGKIASFGPFSDVRLDVGRADPKEGIARPSAENFTAAKETNDRVKDFSASNLPTKPRMIHGGGPDFSDLRDSSRPGQVNSTNSDYRHDLGTSAAVKRSVAYRSISHKITPDSTRTGNIVQNLQTGPKRIAADVSVDQEERNKSPKLFNSHHVVRSSCDQGNQPLPDSVGLEDRANRIPSILPLSSSAGTMQVVESASPNHKLKDELNQESNVHSRYADAPQVDAAGGTSGTDMTVEANGSLRSSVPNSTAVKDSGQIATSELSSTLKPNTENCSPDFVALQKGNEVLLLKSPHDGTNQDGPVAAEATNVNDKNGKTPSVDQVGEDAIVKTYVHKNGHRRAGRKRSIAHPSISFNAGSAVLREAGPSLSGLNTAVDRCSRLPQEESVPKRLVTSLSSNPGLISSSNGKEDRTGLREEHSTRCGNDNTVLPQRGEFQDATKQSVASNGRASSGIYQQNSSRRKKKTLAYATIRSDLQAPPNKIENSAKRRPQTKEITDSEKRQQSTSGLRRCSAKSKLKRGKGDDGVDRSTDSESKRKKANDIFAMLRGGSD